MAILRGRHRLQMKVPPFDAALPLQPLGVCLLRPPLRKKGFSTTKGGPKFDQFSDGLECRITLCSAGRARGTRGALGALACVASWALALLYAYFRVVRRIKSFELPGSVADGHDL